MSDFLSMPIKVKPYFHQQQAFNFACRKFGITAPATSNGVALLMEMGCGKSLTGIGIAGALYQYGKIQRMQRAEMMIVSMHRLQHKRILIGFRIKNGKTVINLLEHQVKLNKFEIKNEKTVDKFERSGYNRSRKRLKTKNT